LEFDAGQLARWDIPESRLPAGSLVRFRPPSLWRDYRKTVLAAVAVGTGQALLIAVIVIERRRRARTQDALAANYRRLHEMGTRVIQAEERERTRIARDLHDDLGQRVASMAIGLSSLRRRLPESAEPLENEVTALQREAARLSSDLRHVSHELHPGMLEQFGLIEALRLHVDELQAQTDMDVQLDATKGWPQIPGAVELCLYRVAQEAIRNAVKHSGARRLTIAMDHDSHGVTLRINDDGVGFDPAARCGGLGLVSLDERLRILGGSLDVLSSPGSGTTVVARVPGRPAAGGES
jgi:two-component system sensor histidine kinase UhpB